MPKTASDLVAERRAQIREIRPGDFAVRRSQTILIDVRAPAEFSVGDIDGAINIPCGALEFQVDADPAVSNVSGPALAHNQQPLVVYCRTGGHATWAAQSRQLICFPDVRTSARGIVDWTAAGLPVSAR